MAKSQKLVLPREWRTFANRYGKDLAYWYVPKGLAVTTAALKRRLEILKEFELGQPWRDCQQSYIHRLHDEGISDAGSEWDGGGAPLARMLKQVFVMLGLAWVDTHDRIEITPAGEKFLTEKDPDGVLSDQMSRYQFSNPSVTSNAHKSISLHPIPFIGEVLRNIDGQFVTGTEYTLFLSRSKKYSDVDSVIDLIERYRGLDPDVAQIVVKTCDSYKLPGIRRSSMYNTIKLDRSYALRMFSLSRLVEPNADGGLSIRKGALKLYRAYLDKYGREGAYIDFANEKDWIAYFGDPQALPNNETALDYYTNKGNVTAAIETKKKTTSNAKDLAEFREMIVSEKALEDYLEGHLDVIGSKIGCKLALVGRQYSTTVGPIDLLAMDNKSGNYVVIELKKGRSADKVYGQCSRYMGWVRKNLAKVGTKVQGVIISRQIDDKLKAARDAHDTKVDLVEFKMSIGAKAV